MCLVFRVQQLFRRFAVLGTEAALLGGFVVLPVEDAVRSLEEPVFVEHGRDLGLEIARRSPSGYRALAEFAQSSEEFFLAQRPLLANPLAISPFSRVSTVSRAYK